MREGLHNKSKHAAVAQYPCISTKHREYLERTKLHVHCADNFVHYQVDQHKKFELAASQHAETADN